MNKINVVITDDHKLFRKGIASLLSEFEFIDQIQEAATGLELIEILNSADPRPDLILLDLKMPEMDGVEANKIIQERYPGMKIIVLSMEDDEQMILYMINEGVNGYVMKSAEPDELENAICKVIKSGYYFSDSINALIFRNLKNMPQIAGMKNVQLTNREKQVLQLICKAHTDVEIAERLNVSVRTINGFRQNLLDKTGTRNMAGLVVYAIKNKLVVI